MNSGGDRAREKEEPLLYTLWLATDTNSKQIKCNENNMKLNQHNRPLLVCALTSSLVEFNSSSSVEFFSRDIRNRSRTYFFSFGRKKKIYWLRNVWVNGKRDKKKRKSRFIGKNKTIFFYAVNCLEETQQMLFITFTDLRFSVTLITLFNCMRSQYVFPHILINMCLYEALFLLWNCYFKKKVKTKFLGIESNDF